MNDKTVQLTSNPKIYANRDHYQLSPEYERHLLAMTAESLDSKSAIAAELAHRDIEIENLRRNLNLRNEQIDGYERQLGIDQAGAERTVGSEIERLRNRLDKFRGLPEHWIALDGDDGEPLDPSYMRRAAPETPQPEEKDLLRNWATKWAWQIPPAAQGELELLALWELRDRRAPETPAPLTDPLQIAMQAGSWFDRKDFQLNQREVEVAKLIRAAQSAEYCRGRDDHAKAAEVQRSAAGFPPRPAQETGAPHTTEDDFAHWLSYSGKGKRATAEQLREWREAYFAGAGLEPTQKATVRYPGMQICRKYTQNGPCLNEIDHQGECDGLPHL